MMPATSACFPDLIAAYLGKPYSPNGHGPDSYGCFGLVYAYLRDSGVPVPSECWTLKGVWTINNYGDLIAMDLDYAEQVMCAVFETIGQPVRPSRKIAGDIMVLQLGNKHLAPAIYICTGNALVAFIDRGVRAVALGEQIEPLIVRRVR